MKKFSIPYFPTGIKYTTPLLFGLGIYLWTMGHPLWTGTLVLLAIIVLTTNYVTEIDLDKKEYRDFVSFLWIPFEEEEIKFKKVDKIVITKINHSDMPRSMQFDWSSFTGTLIIDNNKTLELLSRTNKRELINGLREFVDFLKVDIEDHTTNRPFTININKY